LWDYFTICIMSSDQYPWDAFPLITTEMRDLSKWNNKLRGQLKYFQTLCQTCLRHSNFGASNIAICVSWTASKCIWSRWNWTRVSAREEATRPGGICKNLLACFSHASVLQTHNCRGKTSTELSNSNTKHLMIRLSDAQGCKRWQIYYLGSHITKEVSRYSSNHSL
jgi:hypothetical protein